jgi:glutaredoxin 3
MRRIFGLFPAVRPPHARARGLLVGLVMMTMTGSRARCATHGLLLDDTSTCARCAREAGAQDGKRSLARLVVLAFAIVAALALYRVGTATYEALTSGRRASDPSANAARAQNGSRLVVYTTGSCPACRMAKKWMSENSVAFEERRIDEDASARRELTSLGKGVVVPTFVVDNDQVLTGFDVRGIKLSEALAAHGIAR